VTLWVRTDVTPTEKVSVRMASSTRRPEVPTDTDWQSQRLKGQGEVLVPTVTHRSSHSAEVISQGKALAHHTPDTPATDRGEYETATLARSLSITVPFTVTTPAAPAANVA